MDGDLTQAWNDYCNPRDYDAEREYAEDKYDMYEDDYRL